MHFLPSSCPSGELTGLHQRIRGAESCRKRGGESNSGGLAGSGDGVLANMPVPVADVGEEEVEGVVEARACHDEQKYRDGF